MSGCHQLFSCSSSPVSNLATEMEAMNTQGDSSSDDSVTHGEQQCRTPKRRLNFAGLFPSSALDVSPASSNKQSKIRAPGSKTIRHLLSAPFTPSPKDDSSDSSSMWDSPDMIPTRLYPVPAAASPGSSSVGSFSEFLDPNSMDIKTPSSRRMYRSKQKSITRTPSGSAKSGIRCSLKFSPAGIKRRASSPMKPLFCTSPKRKALSSSPVHSPMKCSPYASASKSNPLSPYKISTMPIQNLFNVPKTSAKSDKSHNSHNNCFSKTSTVSKVLHSSFSDSAIQSLSSVDCSSEHAKDTSTPAASRWRRSHSDSEIKSALGRSAANEDLLGDFSKPYCLPVHSGRHSDLRSISPATMVDLLKGHYSSIVNKSIIIDCRYPYEYHGGHISGALNIYSKPQVISELFDKIAQHQSDDEKRVIVIFHCEFSSERGPKLMRFLRSHDRSVNKAYYPKLCFPELYLLDGGYKAFYEMSSSAGYCSPTAYKPMLDEAHSDDLKFFRRKSRSLNGGSKKRNVPNRSLSFC